MKEGTFHPVSVIIPYYRNETGLAILLATLQGQLVPPEQIIIIDTSKNKSGLAIARRYYTHGPEIKVEYAPGSTIYESWNKGIELAGDRDVIIINDDILVPMNFVDVMVMNMKLVGGYCVVPTTPERDHYKKYVDRTFEWYAPAPEDTSLRAREWMPGFCFMLSRKCINEVGLFDTQFKVWFGDDDYQQRILQKWLETKVPGIVGIGNMNIYHYGGTSYKYTGNEEVLKQIDIDKKLFINKWKNNLKKDGKLLHN